MIFNPGFGHSLTIGLEKRRKERRREEKRF
jgi:hypothetical protein